ncbi:hypothetical protein TNCV_4830571 [Trichonephila clavipes]|nr:hypothetical protein TNCV_4830571 [Trichonephila clavipes]
MYYSLKPHSVSESHLHNHRIRNYADSRFNAINKSIQPSHLLKQSSTNRGGFLCGGHIIGALGAPADEIMKAAPFLKEAPGPFSKP